MALRKFKWNGDKYLEKFKVASEEDLKRAAIFLTNEVKKAINRAKSPPPSAPGEPPHRWKGLLMRSIAWAVDKDKLVARVGSNLPYAKFLELGTTEMQARPFLRVTLAANRDKIARILKGKKKL